MITKPWKGDTTTPSVPPSLKPAGDHHADSRQPYHHTGFSNRSKDPGFGVHGLSSEPLIDPMGRRLHSFRDPLMETDDMARLQKRP